MISIVIPIFNGKNALENCVRNVTRSIKEITDNYEIIIAEDGSTDGSDVLADKLAKDDNKIIHLHSDKRLGRGGALNAAFKKSEGDILIYMDVDLATDLCHLSQLIENIKGGADFATGSRMMSGAQCKRPLKREIASQIYNLLARSLFKIPIHDLQCGFKAFDRVSLLNMIDDIENKHWFWDTECFIRGYKNGYKITEFPVIWTQHTKETKVSVSNDGVRMGKNLVKLWWNLKRDN